MPRLKRAQFWGRDAEDDSLIRQILDGGKNAGAELASKWLAAGGEFDEGGYLVGDLVEVYDQRSRLRCVIRILEVYTTTFGDIPEMLWRGEGFNCAEEFRGEHRKCWGDQELHAGTAIVGYHFILVNAV